MSVSEIGELKLNSLDIIEEGQSLQWSIPAMELRIREAFGTSGEEIKIHEVHIDGVECDSATLNDLLYYITQIKDESGLTSLHIENWPSMVELDDRVMTSLVTASSSSAGAPRLRKMVVWNMEQTSSQAKTAIASMIVESITRSNPELSELLLGWLGCS